MLLYLAESVWKSQRAQLTASFASAADLLDRKSFEEWIERSWEQELLGIDGERFERRTAQQKPRAPGEILEKLYASNDLARGLIVRKALMGPDGVLRDRAKTKELLSNFIAGQMDIPELAAPHVEKFCGALVEVATPFELYHRLAPFISSRIFRRPTESANRRAVIEKSGFYKEAESCTSDSFPDWHEKMPNLIPDSIQIVTFWQQATLDKLCCLFWGSRNPAASAAASSTKYRNIITRIEDGQAKKGRSARLEWAEGLRMALSHEGQLGERLTQTIGIHLQLPPELAQAFAGVYDNLNGQSKLVAYRLIRTLAPGLVRPEDRLLERIGGGSMATVFPLERPGETPRVLKVQNPNAMYRLRENVRFWERVLDRLKNAYEPDSEGGKALEQIRTVLMPGISQWIEGDTEDHDFFKHDSEFRERWHGKIIADVRIVIPLAEPIDKITNFVLDSDETNRLIRSDEMIEGTNLSGLNLAEATDISTGKISRQDYRAVMTALTTNFVQQICSGLTHSNITEGNIRVCRDRSSEGQLQLAYLDRSFPLVFSKPEVEALKGAILSLSGGTSNFLTKFAEAILAAPELSKLSKRAKQNAIKVSKAAEASTDGIPAANNLLQKLEGAKISVPLRYTLLLLNFKALQQLCNKGGITDLSTVVNKPAVMPYFLR